MASPTAMRTNKKSQTARIAVFDGAEFFVALSFEQSSRATQP
jgi:hypothetical protein